MSEPTAPAPICAGKPYPHASAVCDNYAYPCAHEGKQYSLDDVAQLISEWPRAAQCHILAFALALPGTLVSDFWRVLWIADAAAHDADRELDLLSELRGQIEATDKPTGARRPPRLYRQGPGHHAEPRRGGRPGARGCGRFSGYAALARHNAADWHLEDCASAESDGIVP